MKKEKKAKVLTPEQIAKQKAKEAKELARLEKQIGKSKVPGYFVYFMFIIIVVHLVDEITSVIGGQMQSIIASQVFAPIVGEEFAVARMGLFGMITAPLYFLMFFYKPLSDRYGRRPFLIINTLGMGVGLLLISVCTGIPVYLLGSACTGFFVPHDMQSVYVFECTPAKHRAKIFSVIKAVSSLGMLLIPVLRDIYIPSTDLSQWRMVYRVPGIIGVVVAILSLLLIRESDTWIEGRIRTLKMTDEEREEAKLKKQATDEKGGIGNGFKYIFSHKQLRWLAISAGFMFFGFSMTSYYETIMTYGYAAQDIAAGMDLAAAKAGAVEEVTMALMLYPIGFALFQFIYGFFADSLGRKATAIIMSVISVSSFVLFYIGSNIGWNPYLVGFLSGSTVGAYWAATDLVYVVMSSESTPTNLRVSVTTALVAITGLISTFSGLAVTILLNVLGDAKTGLVCLIVAVPGMIVGLILLCAKVKETKGIDLSSIKGDEFENSTVEEVSEETVVCECCAE